MKGICYGLSVGPGDAGLITLDALHIMEEADIIFLPSFPKEKCKAYLIAQKAYPEIDKKDLRCETAASSRDASVMKDRHAEICDQVFALLEEGKRIAFLTLGEVGLYSTYSYIHEKLLERGCDSRLVSGISSVQAIAARLGISLASGREALHIFPDTAHLEAALALPGTKVFMKPKENFDETISLLQDYAKKHETARVCGISNCGMENEAIAENADQLKNLSGYFTVFFVK